MDLFVLLIAVCHVRCITVYNITFVILKISIQYAVVFQNVKWLIGSISIKTKTHNRDGVP